MPPQSDERSIVNRLFEHNPHVLDAKYSTVEYDDGGHVIKLSLSSGSFHDPSSIVEWPTDFGELTHLRELYIYTKLGHFPMSICQLPNLQALILSEAGRHPSVHLPPEFARLRTLRYLGLGGGPGWNGVPPVVWHLSQLRVLDLSGNDFACLPPEIGQLTQLRFCYLMGNRFLKLPAEIGQLTELEELVVWPYTLQALPRAMAQLQKLHALALSPRLLEQADLPRLASEMGMFLDPDPRAPRLQRRAHTAQTTSRYPCACCEYLTWKNDSDICPVCFWEADATQWMSPSSAVGANYFCLIEARLNFARTGACIDRFLGKVRPPQPEEVPEEEERLPHMHFTV